MSSLCPAIRICLSASIVSAKAAIAGGCWVTCCVWGLSVLFCTNAFCQESQPTSWTAERIVAATRSREGLLHGIDAILTIKASFPDLSAYNRAMDNSRDAVAQFYGLLSRPQSHTNRMAMPVAFYRCRWTGVDGLRIDALAAATPDAEILDAFCYDGRAWNHYTNKAWVGPDLIIDGSVAVAPILEYMGVGGRFSRLEAGSYDPKDSLPMPLSDALTSLIKLADGSGEVRVTSRYNSGDGEVIVLDITIPTERPAGDYAYDALRSFKYSFSVARGMAPVAVEFKELIRDKGRVFANPQGTEFEIRWHEFKVTLDGQAVPAKASLTRLANVMMPEATSFYPLTRDGTPVLIKGEKTIDLNRVKWTSHVLEEREVAIDGLRRVSGAEVNLCAAVLPAGAVVEDRLAGESYQLIAEGSPTDELLRAQLEEDAYFIAKAGEKGSVGWSKFWIAANIAAVMALMVALALRRYYTR